MRCHCRNDPVQVRFFLFTCGHMYQRFFLRKLYSQQHVNFQDGWENDPLPKRKTHIYRFMIIINNVYGSTVYTGCTHPKMGDWFANSDSLKEGKNIFIYIYIPSRELTYPPKNGILKMIFLFPRWDMLIPCRVYIFNYNVGWPCCGKLRFSAHSLEAFCWPTFCGWHCTCTMAGEVNLDHNWNPWKLEAMAVGTSEKKCLFWKKMRTWICDMSEVCQVVRTVVRHPGRAIANDIFLLKAKGHD